MAIVRNRRSGAGRGREELHRLIAGLRKRGLRPRLFSRRERLALALESEILRESLAAIVAAGGDGTVSDCINRFPGPPLAILPLGTENLLAKYLGLGRSGEALAGTIASGRTRRFDVGRQGGRRFALMASVGFDADVVHRLHVRRAGNIRRLSYLPRIVESFRKYQYPELRVYVDDATAPLSARLVVALNFPMYAFGLRPAPAARADDGVLDLRLFERGSTFQMLRYMFKVARSAHEGLPDVKSITARRVRIEADIPAPLEADGDPAGTTPVELGIEPSALEVFVPMESKSRL